MKIVLVSNYFNHHQRALADALMKETAGDFYFIETASMGEERKKLGWKMENIPAYVVDAKSDANAKKKAHTLIKQADAVIWGNAPVSYLRERLRAGGLTLRCTERIFKKGFSFPAYAPRAMKHKVINWPCRNQYLLCMSAYAASDYEKIGLYRGKAYRWGYFTETKHYDLDQLFAKKRDNFPPVILWAARMIDWKHPEDMILLAERLKKDGVPFQMKLIGDGVRKNQLMQLAEEKHLEDHVDFLGAMSPENVREHMEKANLFLVTSDQNEGWGAVLNESMNSGCAVVANEAIGSAPYLIKNGVNGLMYPNGDMDALYEMVCELLHDENRTEILGRRAYETIIKEWNAENAASRLHSWIQDEIKKERKDLFGGGLLSKENNG